MASVGTGPNGSVAVGGPKGVAIINGVLCPVEEARVPLTIDGLLRGDGCFETLRVYSGKPFCLAEHLERLGASCRALGLVRQPAAALEALSAKAIEASGLKEAVLRVLVFRGEGEEAEPLTVVMVVPLPPEIPATPEDMESRKPISVRLIAAPWHAGGIPWALSGAKTTSYAPNMAASRQARSEGADEAVLVSRDGFLLEAPTANLWWVREGKLFTPSLDLGILAGITRSKVAQLAAEAGIPVEEGRFTAEHLLTAEEAFLSSSIREVTSIVSVDGRLLTVAAPGPLTRRVTEGFRRLAGA